MSGKIEISRELLERISGDSYQDSLRAVGELRDLLAAPVVEHQKPVAVLYADGTVLNKAECGDAFDTCCRAETPLYTSPPAPVSVVLPEPEQLFEAISGALGEAMDCTRVWAAWGFGTMSESDFVLVGDDQERLHEIASACLTEFKRHNNIPS